MNTTPAKGMRIARPTVFACMKTLESEWTPGSREWGADRTKHLASHGLDRDGNTIACARDAAPDLLAALDRLLRAFEADKDIAPQMDILTSWETNSCAIAQARAAIAKAIGGYRK